MFRCAVRQRVIADGPARRRPPGKPDQLPAERAPNRAREPEPFVQVAHHHPRPGQLVVQDVLAHEHANLPGALADLQPEVHVEQMQEPALLVRQLQIEPDAAARLAVGLREIEDAGIPDREPGEHRVAIGEAVALPGRPHRHLDAEALGERVRLRPVHLLEADQVRVDLPQDLRDAVQIHPPIEPGALVDVVAGHREGHWPQHTGPRRRSPRKPRPIPRSRLQRPHGLC